MISFGFIALLGLALTSLFLLGDYVLMGIFLAFTVLSFFPATKPLGLLFGLGGILLVVLFFFFGFTLPYLSLFTMAALAVGGAILYFLAGQAQ